MRVFIKLLMCALGLQTIDVQAHELPTVAISQIVEHPSLDAVRQGLIDQLNKSGYEDGKSMILIYKNANGIITVSTQIAQNLASLNPTPKAIVAIGTPVAQSVLAVTRGNPIPVVFAAVTDPVSSRLIEDLEHPKGLVTGIVDFPPIEQQLAFMQKVIPTIKIIGVIYNPAESNSVAVIEKFTQIAKKQDFKIIESPVTKTADIGPAATKLIDAKVDAIYVPQDNTAVSAMSSLATICRQYQCPVFTSDNGSVKDGAFAALSYSYYDIGYKTGEYVVQLLQGKDLKELPITSPDHAKVYINAQTAKVLKLTIDAKILKDAEIYEAEKGK